MHITIDDTTITASQRAVFAAIHRRIVTARPEQFDMDDWFSEPNPDDATTIDDEDEIAAVRRQLHTWIDQAPGRSGLTALAQHGDEMLAYCGTAACLAGWAVVAGVDPRRTPNLTDYPYLYERNIAMQLGMHVNFEAYEQDIHDMCGWFFVTRWPEWTLRHRRAVSLASFTDMHIIEQEDNRAIVVAVLGEFIDGERTDWWHPPLDVDRFDERIRELVP